MAAELAALISRGRQLLASRESPAAIEVFTQGYQIAVAAGDRPAAAHCMLGLARAEFAGRRLEEAAGHAALALEQLTALASPEVQHAADLIVQIDHNRYLR